MSDLIVYFRVFKWFWVIFICVFLRLLLCCEFGIAKNHALFWVTLFSLKLGWCKENDIFHVWPPGFIFTVTIAASKPNINRCPTVFTPSLHLYCTQLKRQVKCQCPLIFLQIALLSMAVLLFFYTINVSCTTIWFHVYILPNTRDVPIVNHNRHTGRIYIATIPICNR